MAGNVQSVQRAILVLRAFASAEEWGTSALARKLGLHKSVVHRLLVTLANGGLLTQDPRTGAFALAPTMIALGRRAERGGGLRAIARPVLQRLVEESRETVSLCVMQEDHGLCIEVIDSPQSMRFTFSPGDSFPLNAGCVGKVILAFQAPAFIEALIQRGKFERFTANTITEPKQLLRELARIRLQGHGFSDAEITPGARSVGAPVYDADGRVTSSLVISAPSVRMTDGRLEHFIEMVARAAARLSHALGHQIGEDMAGQKELHDAVQQ